MTAAAFAALRAWAHRLHRDGLALWFAVRHPDTPWYAKALAAVIVAYALSPIDLIPDFVPVLGYLDDLLLLPGLIWLAVRWLPAGVLAQCRADAEAWLAASRERPRSRAGAVAIVLIWGLVAWALAAWAWRAWAPSPPRTALARVEACAYPACRAPSPPGQAHATEEDPACSPEPAIAAPSPSKFRAGRAA